MFITQKQNGLMGFQPFNNRANATKLTQDKNGRRS